MNSIKEVFFNIALISIVCGLLDVLSISGKLKKYVIYIASLIIILSIISPISNLTNLFDNNEFNYSSKEEQIKNTSYINQSIELVITNDICNYFTLPTSAINSTATLSIDKNQTIIENIDINILDSKYNRHAQRIDTYLRSRYSCEISVNQKIEE